MAAIPFEIVTPYTLRVEFNDSAEQTIDFWPILAGFCLSPLFAVLTSTTPQWLCAARAVDAVRLGLATVSALARVLVKWVGVGSVGPHLLMVTVEMVALNEGMERAAARAS